jgi:hypothetical protein
VIWIKEVDNNRKKIVQFTNFHKKLDLIWEIRDANNSMVCYFKDKDEEGVQYFQSLFQDPRGCLIQKILEFNSKFLPIFTTEMNIFFTKGVLEVGFQVMRGH